MGEQKSKKKEHDNWWPLCTKWHPPCFLVGLYRPIELVRCIPFIFPKLFYSIKFSYQHKSATNQLIIMKSAIKIHLPPSSGIWARSEVCTSPKQRGGLKCWMGNAFGKSQKKSWRTVEKNIINDNDIHEGSQLGKSSNIIKQNGVCTSRPCFSLQDVFFMS